MMTLKNKLYSNFLKMSLGRNKNGFNGGCKNASKNRVPEKPATQRLYEDARKQFNQDKMVTPQIFREQPAQVCF